MWPLFSTRTAEGWYCTFSDASSTRADFDHALKAAGLEERQYLIWAKPALVLGLIEVESGFRKYAVSAAGIAVLRERGYLLARAGGARVFDLAKGDVTFAADLPEDRVMWSEIVPGGCHWSYVMPRGSRLRMVALDAGANLSMVLYHAREKLERYNMPDSL